MPTRTKRDLTLDERVAYQIVVPGELGECWSDWIGDMKLEVVCQGDGPPVTILTGALDQAALHGLLRRLYSLGLPLLSVNGVEMEE
jgi:hypothetical protein